MKLVSLQSLNLNQNLINRLNMNLFGSQNNLSNLSSSNNLIEKFVIGEFQVLKNLSYLDLSSNAISKAYEFRDSFVSVNLN